MAPTREEDKQHNRDGFEKRAARKAKSTQSGSGRGTLGPDHHRDSSKYAQTMAKKYGITKPQKTQTGDGDQQRVMVEAEEARIHDGSEELVVTSEKRQRNVMVSRKEGTEEALVGHTNTAKHGEQAVQTAQAPRDTPARPVPNRSYEEARLAQAMAKQHAYDVVRSTSAIGLSTSTPFRTLNERIIAPSEGRTTRPQGETTSQAGMSHNKHCANCGGDGHLLGNCVTAEHGSIWVCVFCKTKDHFTDTCPSFKKLSLAAKVKLLVTDRAGKPPLSTHRCWCVFLHDFLVSEETKDLRAPTAFPWRLTFAEDLYKSRNIHQIQEEFDRTKDASKLPKDLELQSLEGVYLRHWKIEELPMPHPDRFSDSEE